MPEHGLSPAEVGKEIAEHREHALGHGHGGGHDMGGHEGGHDPNERHDRRVSVVEAVLLAVVAVLAAWSGFAAAKWGTEGQLKLAAASTARTDASRYADLAGEQRNFDAIAFNSWFGAALLGNEEGMTLAERRFGPEMSAAFDVWMAQDPFTNPDAPPSPMFVDEYEQEEQAKAEELDAQAEQLYAEGAEDAENGDQFVRVTVLLATVLFLVGISGHFRVRGARYALVTIGALMMVTAVVVIFTLPPPPR